MNLLDRKSFEVAIRLPGGKIIIRKAKVCRVGNLVFLEARVQGKDWIINNGDAYLEGDNLPYYELYIPINR